MAGNDNALSQLQSDAQTEVLDAVDKLRLDGFQRELKLPQLVVCGDQSSGKSAVLEAISRVRFPVKDTFETKFASELVLRRASEDKFHVRIVPASYRDKEQQKQLEDFRPPDHLKGLDDFPEAINAAKSFLEELDSSRKIYEDKLVAIIRGPELPPLTLVDLPGLIHSANSEQNKNDIETVRNVAKSYMKDDHSIILAILAANNNFANQVVLELAKEVDDGRNRTLGIITKPDDVPAGSALEAQGIGYARNRNVAFDLGWHVLRNRDYDNRSVTSDERDRIEAEFFSQESKYNWNTLPANDLGAKALREKLSHVLLKEVGKSLPSLIKDIRETIIRCEAKKKMLGEPKLTEAEQRPELVSISHKVHNIVQAGLQANYVDPFFSNSQVDAHSNRRLRTGLREYIGEFAEHLDSKGPRYFINEDSDASEIEFLYPEQDSDAVELPRGVPLRAMLNWIADQVKENRGCEPHGQYPHGVISEVFHIQCSRWEAISQAHIHQCWQYVCHFFELALFACAPIHIAQKIWDFVAFPGLENTLEAVRTKLSELLKPYQNGHPITLNNSLLSFHREQIRGKYATFLNDNDSAEIYAASDIFAYVVAFYEIARMTFKDNVANLAIEHCLVASLSDLFTPTRAAQMPVETLHDLMAEPEGVAREREENLARLNTLTDILKILSKYENRSDSARIARRSKELKVPTVPVISGDDTNTDTPPTVPTLPSHVRNKSETTPTRSTEGYPSPPKSPSLTESANATPTQEPVAESNIHQSSANHLRTPSRQSRSWILKGANGKLSRSPSPLHTAPKQPANTEQDIRPDSEEL